MPENFFKSRRDELHLTQREMANRAGVTDGAISGWEAGQPPRLNLHQRLAKAYEVSEDRIIDEIVKLTKRRPLAAKSA